MHENTIEASLNGKNQRSEALSPLPTLRDTGLPDEKLGEVRYVSVQQLFSQTGFILDHMGYFE